MLPAIEILPPSTMFYCLTCVTCFNVYMFVESIHYIIRLLLELYIIPIDFAILLYSIPYQIDQYISGIFTLQNMSIINTYMIIGYMSYAGRSYYKTVYELNKITKNILSKNQEEFVFRIL